MNAICKTFTVFLLGSCNLLQSQHITLAQGAFSSSALNAEFIAKFALYIAVLLLWTVGAAKILKHIFYVPLIAGQIVAGIILGPSVINVSSIHYFAEPVKLLDQLSLKIYAPSSDLFLFFVLLLSSSFTVGYLLWIAGHETDIKDLLKVGFSASTAGTLGATIPILMTVGVAYFFFGQDFNLLCSTALGLAFAATSVSIPVAMLFSQNKMHLRSSKAMLGAAIIDDIFAILLLSLFFIAVDMGFFGKTACATTTAHVGLVKALAYLVLTFIILLCTGYWAIRPLMTWLHQKKLSHLVSPLGHGVMFIYFAVAELLGGLAGITGAYFAGLFHRMGDSRHHAEKTISPFVNAVLLPLFLCSIGLQVDIKLLNASQWIIVGVLLCVAIVSKLVGCFIATGMSNLIYQRGKKRIGWSMLESYLFGSSMIARGEVGLVVSTVLNGAKIITPEQYVIAVIVIVLTTIASPIMLSLGFAYEESHSTTTLAPISLNLGVFDVIGTSHLFNIILGCIESSMGMETTVHFSEGRKIVTARGYNVKIILCPDIGILFEGNKEHVNTIMNMVRNAVQQELERCTISSS